MMTESYESVLTRHSAVHPGISFKVEKMSFGRRIELMKAVRELTARGDFLSSDSEMGRMTSAILSAEVDQLYIRWGVKEIHGLLIDGVPATTESLIAFGPEDLLQEALDAVKCECGLTEAEKKT